MKFVKEMIIILVCKLGDKEINCYDGGYSRETLKQWSKKGILRCPCCGGQYTYNHGRVRIPYFKHLNADCVLYGEPETEEHIKGKIDLFEWVKNQDGVTDVVLEGWIPATKQRPDIMFRRNNKQYVIEYQCSPISSEYIKRHELYQAAGIHDIWICGTEKYFGANKKINTLESKTCLYYDSKNQMFYKLNNLPESIFKEFENKHSIQKNGHCFHLMNNICDYDSEANNYMLIKGVSNSYKCVGSDFLLQVDKHSNKHSYPVKNYRYTKNYSFARCYKHNDFKIFNIIQFNF